MKRLIFSILILLLAQFSNAQLPVHWNFSAKKINKQTFELHYTATLDTGWYIYSSSLTNNGPLPTSIHYERNPLVQVSTGKPKEIGLMREKFESTFGVQIQYYYDKVELVQVVTLNKPVKTTLRGNIQYMSCNALMCLPPQKQPFKIQLNGH